MYLWAQEVLVVLIRWSQTLLRGAQSKDQGLQSQAATGDIPVRYGWTFLADEGGWVLGQPRPSEPALGLDLPTYIII